jgi:hypothetical protein
MAHSGILISLRADYEGKLWLCIGEKEVFELDKLYLPRQIRDRLRWAGQPESLCEELISCGLFFCQHSDSLGDWHYVVIEGENERKILTGVPYRLPRPIPGFRGFIHYQNTTL